MSARGGSSETQLFRAVGDTNLLLVRRLILKGADVNKAIGACGLFPLHKAASVGDLKMIECLLDNGADVDVIDKRKKTALHHAIGSDHSIADLLLSRGSDVDAADDKSRTPLHISCERWDCPDETFYALLDYGADVNHRDANGKTALHIAIECGRVDRANILLRHGVDPNVPDGESLNPLHRLCGSKKTKASRKMASGESLGSAGGRERVFSVRNASAHRLHVAKTGSGRAFGDPRC